MCVVITPTGDRPKQIELCQRFVAQQTVAPFRWIIVDDGKAPLGRVKGAQVYRREPEPDDPPHTLLKNLEFIKYFIMPEDKIVIMEDDDFYFDSYVETISKLLDGADLVGQCKTIYYHFPAAKIWHMGNTDHASLFKTGFRGRVLMSLAGVRGHGVDLALWKMNVSKKLIDGPPLAIGIKGLPGRQGLSAGWDLETYADKWQDDFARRWLRDTIGNQAVLDYEGMI